MSENYPGQTSWFDASQYNVPKRSVSKKDSIDFVQDFDSGHRATLRWCMGTHDVLVEDPDGKTMTNDWIVTGQSDALRAFKIACDLVSSFTGGDRDFDTKPWADLIWIDGLIVDHEN